MIAMMMRPDQVQLIYLANLINLNQKRLQNQNHQSYGIPIQVVVQVEQVQVAQLVHQLLQVNLKQRKNAHLVKRI